MAEVRRSLRKRHYINPPLITLDEDQKQAKNCGSGGRKKAKKELAGSLSAPPETGPDVSGSDQALSFVMPQLNLTVKQEGSSSGGSAFEAPPGFSVENRKIGVSGTKCGNSLDKVDVGNGDAGASCSPQSGNERLFPLPAASQDCEGDHFQMEIDGSDCATSNWPHSVDDREEGKSEPLASVNLETEAVLSMCLDATCKVSDLEEIKSVISKCLDVACNAKDLEEVKSTLSECLDAACKIPDLDVVAVEPVCYSPEECQGVEESQGDDLGWCVDESDYDQSVSDPFEASKHHQEIQDATCSSTNDLLVVRCSAYDDMLELSGSVTIGSEDDILDEANENEIVVPVPTIPMTRSVDIQCELLKGDPIKRVENVAIQTSENVLNGVGSSANADQVDDVSQGQAAASASEPAPNSSGAEEPANGSQEPKSEEDAEATRKKDSKREADFLWALYKSLSAARRVPRRVACCSKADFCINTERPVLYVTNMAKETKAFQLYALFSLYGHVLSICIVRIPEPETDTISAYIILSTRDEAARCVYKLNNITMNSKKLNVIEANFKVINGVKVPFDSDVKPDVTQEPVIPC